MMADANRSTVATSDRTGSRGRSRAATASTAVTAWCSVCAADVTLERVPCGDGHGADCPEWVCVECSYVLVLSAVVDAAGAAVAGAA